MIVNDKVFLKKSTEDDGLYYTINSISDDEIVMSRNQPPIINEIEGRLIFERQEDEIITIALNK